MTDEAIEQERLRARYVCNALHRIQDAIRAGRSVTPSDLSVSVRKAKPRSETLFLWMASRAVCGKYQQAGRHRVAARLEEQALVLQRKFPLQSRTWADRQEMQDAGRRLQAFYRGHRRISHYQSRVMCADLDIVLCANGMFSLDFGLTPWVCQCPDLRFRWTDDSLARLAYLTDCWDAYSRCNFTWEDRFIGLPDFPTHPDFC